MKTTADSEMTAVETEAALMANGKDQDEAYGKTFGLVTLAQVVT